MSAAEQVTPDLVVEFFADVWDGGTHSVCVGDESERGGFQAYDCFTGSELHGVATGFGERFNVWVGALPLKTKPDPGRRGKKADVADEVEWLFADLDWKHFAHKDSHRLPTEQAVRDAVEKFEPMPTWVIHTGHGYQCWWKLDRPVDADEWARAARGLKKQLEAVGLHVERTTDRASVLRPPGSINMKRVFSSPLDGTPKPVTVHAHTGATHSPDVFTTSAPASKKAGRKQKAVKPITEDFYDGFERNETPADFIRRDGDGQTLEELLVEAGCEIGGDLGVEGIDVTRPGKDGGTSARIHTNDDGSQYVNLFSSGFPEAWYEVGTAGDEDPVWRTLTKFDLLVAEKYDGDAEAAGRDIRKRMGKQAAPSVTNIPAEFFDARPMLGHIRDAAQARQVAPDAVLGVVLARFSAMVPPSFIIPAIIGSTATFDHMTVNVSPSGGGKSSALGVGRELLPATDDKRIVLDLPAGSGEGLLEALFENVTVEDGGKKPKTEKKRTRSAVMFVADEAKGFVETTKRSGTTIASVLCSAWSGQTLGQANASQETHRVIPAGTARISGVMGVQTSLGHILMTQDLVDQGLAGRLTFFSAVDPSMPHPDDAPAWPGPLDLKPPVPAFRPEALGGKYWDMFGDDAMPPPPTRVTYPDEVATEVREARHAVVTGKTVEDPVEGHQRLGRMKLAGLLALMDGRTEVTVEDWSLAAMVVDASRGLRESMKAEQAGAAVREIERRGAADGRRRVVADMTADEIRQTAVVEAAQWVRDRVKKVGEQSRRELNHSVSNKRRSVLDEAIDTAEANGWVKVRVEDTHTGSDARVIGPA